MSVPDLYLAVDFGASATKFSFSPGNSELDSRFQVKLMPPDVEIISREKLQRYFARNTIQLEPRDELEEVWLEAKGQLYALGKLAQQFEPVALISEVKYEKAAYKTLAALGYALSACTQSGKLPKKKVYKVSLAVLLPWSEFPDKERYKSFVSALLSEAKYRDAPLSVKLSTFSVRQEGFGLFYLSQQISQSYSPKQLTILLFGHRNLSVLFFSPGQPPKGASPLLGFHQVLDAVADSISWLDWEQVLRAWEKSWFIYRRHFFDGTYCRHSPENYTKFQKYGFYFGKFDHYVRLKLKCPHWQDLPPIQQLARARDPDLRQQEITDIHQAFQRALDDYWESFEKWFKGEFPEASSSSLLVSGGASWFIFPKLAAFCGLSILGGMNGRYTDSWGCQTDEDFIQRFLVAYMASLHHSDKSFYNFTETCEGSSPRLASRVALYQRLYELAKVDEENFPPSEAVYASDRSWHTSRQRAADVIGLSAYLRERKNDG